MAENLPRNRSRVHAALRVAALLLGLALRLLVRVASHRADNVLRACKRQTRVSGICMAKEWRRHGDKLQPDSISAGSRSSWQRENLARTAHTSDDGINGALDVALGLGRVVL